jgi:hypothetical protein
MRNYIGLFIISLATIMYELLLTRIFSITMYYHFAFMVISIAMLGMTVGAIIVYLAPRFFEQNIIMTLAVASLFFGLSISAGFYCYCQLPNLLHAFDLNDFNRTWVYLLLTYVFTGIPFILSGIVICVALTKLLKPIAKLYAADLLGAALGCLLLILLLNWIDGASSVLFVGGLACLGGFFFVPEKKLAFINKIALMMGCALILIATVNGVFASYNAPLIRITQTPPTSHIPINEYIYEKWNSFSRILVHGNPSIPRRPMAWGLSAKWPQEKKVSELTVTIDSAADTPMTKFQGDLREIEHLQYDIVNAVHLIRSNANVLVIGVGGGRDILSALFYHQKHILGVEINNRILDALTKRFGDYTGHLDRYPQVQLVNDEARSYIARSPQHFDIIQISLIDTFAATASGAFVFTENALYTQEAWKTFIEHLNVGGILSVSRWYYNTNLPGEIYRSLALAATTLRHLGVTDPRKNIVIIASKDGGYGGRIPWNVGTLLISKQPLSEQDLKTIDTFAHDKGFQIVLSPTTAMDSNLVNIVSSNNLDELAKKFPINILPTSDDKPFFFHTLKFYDLFNPGIEKAREYYAVITLWCLLAIVITLSTCFILLPLCFKAGVKPMMDGFPLLLYFCGIGLGFMFIEISQMQRLILFLGYPVYSLSVVLFTLLLGGGIGSYSVSYRSTSRWLNRPSYRLIGMLIALIIFGWLTPDLIADYRGYPTFVRIGLSMMILMPLGFFMGMAFPIGMNLGNASFEKLLLPWFWGINGAASVCASILALVVSLTFGISMTFWVGFACYLVAFLAFLRALAY